MILRWYKYPFYRVYLWRLSRPSPISDPEFDAALLIAMANILYIIAFVEVFSAFSKPLQHLLYDNFAHTKFLVAVFSVPFILVHGYLYAWSKKAKKWQKIFGKKG